MDTCSQSLSERIIYSEEQGVAYGAPNQVQSIGLKIEQPIKAPFTRLRSTSSRSFLSLHLRFLISPLVFVSPMTVHAAISDVIDLDNLHFLLSLGFRRRPRHLFSQSMPIGCMSCTWSHPSFGSLNLQDWLLLNMLFADPLLRMSFLLSCSRSSCCVLAFIFFLCPAGPWFYVTALLLFTFCFILLSPSAAGLPLRPFSLSPILVRCDGTQKTSLALWLQHKAFPSFLRPCPRSPFRTRTRRTQACIESALSLRQRVLSRMPNRS